MKATLFLPVMMMFHLTPVILSDRNVNYRRLRREVPEYKIDVLAVVDWKMFDHWLDLYQQSEAEAESNLRKYMALVFKGVNQRYSNIEDYKLTVDVANIIIFKNKANDQITPTNSIMNIVSANTTLFRLTNYVKNNGLTSYDHVMLFTGHDIFSTDNGILFRYTTGQAFVGTMCQGQEGASVSVIEDRGAFQSVHTAAHELAHSLSALHDGSENACALGDRYIMAGGSSEVTPSNVYHPWYFSSCTIQKISTFLTKTMSTHAACLSTAMPRITANVPDVTHEEMGRLYSPDVLCQHMYGSGSYYCRTLENVSSICHSMFCSNNNLVSGCNQHHAPDFMSCGDKKWCENGQCVFSEKAPSKDASCVHGDQPSKAINGKTCTALVAESKVFCYDSSTRVRCCHTCNDASSGVLGCEYGDKKTGCSANLCNLIEADGNVVDETCCGTCNFRPAEWACRDSSTSGIDCARVEAHQCYNRTIAFHCCARCANARKKENKGCEYGDKASNCDILTSRGRRCDDEVKPFCCKTCSQEVNAQSQMALSTAAVVLTIFTTLMFHS